MGSYSVELTAEEKSKVRTIQNSCDTQGALASLSNEEVGRIFKEKCQRNVDGMIEGYKKPKVIKLALDNHDLAACNILKTIDGCVMAYVEEFKEIEACDVLDSKDDCVTTFAIDSQIFQDLLIMSFFPCQPFVDQKITIIEKICIWK